jgi:hypothetical protein
MTPSEIIGAVVLRKFQTNIPNSVLPKTAELIQDCLAINYWERPSFTEILDRLEEMQFKLIARVNSSKLTAFVKEIREWETNNCSQ